MSLESGSDSGLHGCDVDLPGSKIFADWLVNLMDTREYAECSDLQQYVWNYVLPVLLAMEREMDAGSELAEERVLAFTYDIFRISRATRERQRKLLS
jgi:hypothetical protein